METTSFSTFNIFLNGVDGDEKITLKDFIDCNPDISITDLVNILKLEIGQRRKFEGGMAGNYYITRINDID